MPRPKLKQRKDGRYRCKRGNMVFYGSTSLEAYAARDAYDLEVAQGLIHNEHGITVSEYAEKWLPVHRHKSCPKSYKLYEKILISFTEFLQDKRIRDVTPTDIRAFYNTLDGFSQSYISKHTVTVSSLFKSAVDDGIIQRNPCSPIEKPKGVSGTHRVIEPWEREIIHSLISHRFGIAVMLMLYEGLRRGEALAFDLDRDIVDGRVYVREAVSFSYGSHSITKYPKTSAGLRDLPLFEPMAISIQGMSGKAFKTAICANTSESAFQSAWSSYKLAFERLSGEKCTIRTHDLRHSFCTMLCDAGVDMKTAMRWMGHSDEAMIRRIYDHLSVQREKAAEKNVADLIGKNLLSGSVSGSK